jgi:hypothetical protein
VSALGQVRSKISEVLAARNNIRVERLIDERDSHVF